MKKESLAIISSVFLLWGCNSGDGDQATNVSPSTTPTSQERQNQEETNQDNQQGDKASTILATSDNTTRGSSGLIPTTDADERLKQINQGRNDPFSVIPPPQAIINIQAPSDDSNDDDDSTDSNSSNSSNSSRPISTKSTGGSISACESSTFAVNKPSMPEPLEAQGVLVSGIIDIDGEDVAIVKSLDYDYSYPIRQGNYIANGLVLVKSIDSYGENPSVILEQYGQEVVRTVGDPPQSNDGGNKGDSELPFQKEQLNIVNNDIRGLKLISIEDLVKKYDRETGSDILRDLIVISGYVCNTTKKPLSLSSLKFDLSTNDLSLPRVNASFPSNSIIIQPNKKTLFTGSIPNSKVFNTPDKIEIRLSDWD